jgi:hypothetical protein
MDDSVRERDSMRFTTPSGLPGEFGVRCGEAGNNVVRSRAGLVGVRMFDGVLETEPTSGIVVLLRIGLVTLGGDKCALDGGCTISTSILGRFRGGESTISASVTSGRAWREFLRPYVLFMVAVVVVRIQVVDRGRQRVLVGIRPETSARTMYVHVTLSNLDLSLRPPQPRWKAFKHASTPFLNPNA